LNSTTPEKDMKCPICADETAGQETQQWGPEWAHVRCVRAYNLGKADALATAGQQPVEPACPVCNRTPVFEHDRRVAEWSGHCKHCAVEGPTATTEEEARRLWIVWHHKRSDAQSLLVNSKLGDKPVA
jgi:hypothetical protein